VADASRALLRHTLATVAYRGGKAIRDAPEPFWAFRVAPGSRTPIEILTHIGDLFDWAMSLADGQHVWHDATPLPWRKEVARFFETLRRFDDRLASETPLGCAPEKLFQGPIADSLTHIGQITMLRRIAGTPIRGESYYRADIVAGRVGSEQAPPELEFD
jgi:hypothetical protein